MANFLVVVSDGAARKDRRLFDRGLEVARRLKRQEPAAVLETDWAHVAAFSRENGSAPRLVSDPNTGQWLLAAGTWFHRDDYATGSEERLLERYQRVGAGQVGQELEGFFAIVVGEPAIREAIVLTDLAGSCHCFVRSWPGITALSGSSMLLAAVEASRLDPVGCQEFLATGVIYEDRSLYREVRKLGPARAIRIGADGPRREERYWRLADVEPESLDGRPAVAALGDALVGAARRVARTFPRPVCDLTGGYDSRAVVAAFVTAGIDVTTVVVGPPDSRDVVVARRVARIADRPFLHLAGATEASLERIEDAIRLTDGEYDAPKYVPVLEVHRSLAAGFDVSVNGSFGELARGYWWELLGRRGQARGPLDAARIARARYAAEPFERTLVRPEHRLEIVSHLVGVIERASAEVADLPSTAQMDNLYLVMRMQRWQGRIASSTDQVWPCLSLFLLRSVLQTVLRTAARGRRRGLLIRRLLKELQPAMAECPLEHGYPAVPLTVANWPRFWPVFGAYAGRAWARARRAVGVRAKGGHGIASARVRAMLWQDEAVQSLLHPGSMKTAELVDTGATARWLERSRHATFPFTGQWERLLGLEVTMRAVAAVSGTPGESPYRTREVTRVGG